MLPYETRMLPGIKEFFIPTHASKSILSTSALPPDLALVHCGLFTIANQFLCAYVLFWYLHDLSWDVPGMQSTGVH